MCFLLNVCDVGFLFVPALRPPVAGLEERFPWPPEPHQPDAQHPLPPDVERSASTLGFFGSVFWHQESTHCERRAERPLWPLWRLNLDGLPDRPLNVDPRVCGSVCWFGPKPMDVSTCIFCKMSLLCCLCGGLGVGDLRGGVRVRTWVKRPCT